MQVAGVLMPEERLAIGS